MTSGRVVIVFGPTQQRLGSTIEESLAVWRVALPVQMTLGPQLLGVTLLQEKLLMIVLKSLPQFPLFLVALPCECRISKGLSQWPLVRLIAL